MRKIEEAMRAAIERRINWRAGNTAVIQHDDRAEVRLHGHRVAEYEYGRGVIPDADTFRNWPTATTRSRLRALGVAASIRHGRACINGEEV